MSGNAAISCDAAKENLVVCQTNQGLLIRATVVRFTRHKVVFQLHSSGTVLLNSEVLSEFQILVQDRPIYSGRAVVSNVINTGATVICEATLEESWIDIDLFGQQRWQEKLREDFGHFIQSSQRNFKVSPEFKLAVGDLQMMLLDLRGWMDQVELGVRSQPDGNRDEFEAKLLRELKDEVLPTLGLVFERFERQASQVEQDFRPVHSVYAKRQLHPSVLCAPFMYRTFQKPLGYAGDYEMVNMMVRNPFEGSSVFAKLLNTFFLNTPPVVAHRNRIQYLVEMLKREVSRVACERRPAKILSMGCGPAQEIQAFLQSTPISDYAEFALFDFNDETIQHTGTLLQQIKLKNHRRTVIQVFKKSVTQLLKDAAKLVSRVGPGNYDVVYCTGLFDYMPDYVCEKLVSVFYDMLRPGGLVVTSNVDPSNQSRGWMELVVDWHLYYRNGRGMAALTPQSAPANAARIFGEMTGVNVFLEVRKPQHA